MSFCLPGAKVRTLGLTIVIGLSVLLAGCGGDEAEPQPVVSQVEQQQQLEPEPEQPAQQNVEPQAEAEAQQREQAQAEPEVQQQVQPAQDAVEEGFLGESTQSVDPFSGRAETFLTVVGNGVFPFLELFCEDQDLRLVLADIPKVTSDGRFAYVQYVTSETMGSPREAQGRLFDSVDGARNWELTGSRSIHLTEVPAETSAITDRGWHFLWSLATSPDISVRMATNDDVFSVTFSIGDITHAEHWDDIVACDGSAN